MAQLIINIPDEVLDRTLDAICVSNNYKSTIEVNGIEVPNPQTKSQFAKQWLITQIKHVVKHYESTLAANAAKETAEQQAETEINLT